MMLFHLMMTIQIINLPGDKEINKIDTKEEVDVDSHSNKDSEELFSIKEDCIDLNSKDCEDSEDIIDSITLDSRSDTEEFIYESDGKGRYGKYIRKVYNKFIILKSIKGEDVKFGSFDSHEEALKARDKLIEDNWGFPKDEDVNLNREGQYGKYIVNLNGVFKIAKLVDGSIRSFGYYKDLETAQRVRDLLVDNNWDMDVIPFSVYENYPYDKNFYIRSSPDGYIVTKVIDGELKYFGTYSTRPEAIAARDKLVANNWEIYEEMDEEEEYDINIYLKGDVFTVKKEFDGKFEIFGTFYDSIEAINFRNLCIRQNWNVEKVFNVPLEKEFPSSLKFPVTVGLSSKNKGWTISREFIKDFLPIQKCEGNIPIEIDGISTVISSKFLVRLFYNKNEVLSQHLEDKLLEHNSNLADVEIFLNQEISDIQETLDFGYIDEELEFLEITKEFTANFSKKGMFTIPRESSKYLFSILPYESRCNFEVDGIKAEGRINLLLRCRLDKETLEYLNSSKNIGDKIIIKFPVLK